MKPQTGPRVLTTVAILTMIVSGVGFIVMMVANAFFFDEYDKYGEVPIPGSSSLHLEAGDVTVTFHTVLIGGGGSGSGAGRRLLGDRGQFQVVHEDVALDGPGRILLVRVDRCRDAVDQRHEVVEVVGRLRIRCLGSLLDRRKADLAGAEEVTGRAVVVDLD